MTYKQKKLLKKLLPLLALALILLVMKVLPGQEASRTSPQAPSRTSPVEELQVHFIDVGQGDSIFIRQGSHTMLIDAGTASNGDTVTDYLREQGVSSLTYVVATHPHADHIGGLAEVLRAFPAQNLLMPQLQASTQAFENMVDAALEQELKAIDPAPGDTFPLGTAVITAVNCLETGDYNNASLILRLDYGERSFLFTGDAEAEAEEAVLQSGANVDCDVLKVGHHGSVTSTTPEFLQAVSPTHAVISCGVGNDYGHPHLEIRDALSRAGIRVLRTDHHGTVVAVTDGSSLEFNVEPAAADGGELYVLTGELFHVPACEEAEKTADNKQTSIALRQTLLEQRLQPCPLCRP